MRRPGASAGAAHAAASGAQTMKRIAAGLIAALMLSPASYAAGTETFGVSLGKTTFEEFTGKYPAYFSEGKSGCEDYQSYGVYTSQIEDDSLFSLQVSFDGNGRAAAVAARLKKAKGDEVLSILREKYKEVKTAHDGRQDDGSGTAYSFRNGDDKIDLFIPTDGGLIELRYAVPEFRWICTKDRDGNYNRDGLQDLL